MQLRTAILLNATTFKCNWQYFSFTGQEYPFLEMPEIFLSWPVVSNLWSENSFNLVIIAQYSIPVVSYIHLLPVV